MDRDLVAPAFGDVAVEAVFRRIELATDKPFRERGLAPVEHLIPGLLPLQGRGALAPPALRILEGTPVQSLVILHGLDVGLGGKLGGRGEDPVFFLERFDVLAHVAIFRARTLASSHENGNAKIGVLSSSLGPEKLDRASRQPALRVS